MDSGKTVFSGGNQLQTHYYSTPFPGSVSDKHNKCNVSEAEVIIITCITIRLSNILGSIQPVRNLTRRNLFSQWFSLSVILIK